MTQKRKAAAAEAAAKRAQKTAPAPVVEKKPATKSPTFSLCGAGSPQKKATPEPVVVEKKPATKSPTFSK